MNHAYFKPTGFLLQAMLATLAGLAQLSAVAAHLPAVETNPHREVF
jgi:hypothetical protein